MQFFILLQYIIHSGSRNTKICGLENFECYTQAIYKHLSGALDTGSDDEYFEAPISPIDNMMKIKSNITNDNVTNSNMNETVRKLISDRRYPFYLYKYRQWQQQQRNKNDSTIRENEEKDSKYDHVAFDYKCKCLPACNSINYMADYRTSSFYLENIGLDYNTLPLG